MVIYWIFMRFLKNIILSALIACVGFTSLRADQENIFGVQVPVPPRITDGEFDVIITKPWENLSAFDKEKIGGYLLAKMQKPNLKVSLELCAKITKYKEHIKELVQLNITPKLRLTPTDKHMIRYPQAIVDFTSKGSLGWHGEINADLATVNALSAKIYEVSQTLEQQNYAVFFHGQRWALTLLQRIYKDLYQAYYKTTVRDDFTFIHFKPPNKNYNQEEEKTRRTSIIASKNGWWNISYALFMNKPLFGNVNFGLSNSFYFFANNYNEGVAINVPDMKDIFSFFHAESIYQTYETELRMLQNLHRDASIYGNMLAIAIPKSIVKDCVFKTRDNSKDEREYCLVMTHDIGLNPDSGIKVLHFNAPDEAKYQQFEAAYNELMTRIVRSI